MIHDYDNPNTCYAIGDAIAVVLGTGTVNRQPAAGVEEQISMVGKGTTGGGVFWYDGVNADYLLLAPLVTNQVQGNAAAGRQQFYNMAWMLTNSVYALKDDAAGKVYLGGVQTNA